MWLLVLRWRTQMRLLWGMLWQERRLRELLRTPLHLQRHRVLLEWLELRLRLRQPDRPVWGPQRQGTTGRGRRAAHRRAAHRRRLWLRAVGRAMWLLVLRWRTQSQLLCALD